MVRRRANKQVEGRMKETDLRETVGYTIGGAQEDKTEILA